MSTRRALLAAGLALPSLAQAQGTGAWPDKPMRYLIGGAAGGVSDIFLRICETRLRERLGQTVVQALRHGRLAAAACTAGMGAKKAVGSGRWGGRTHRVGDTGVCKLGSQPSCPRGDTLVLPKPRG